MTSEKYEVPEICYEEPTPGQPPNPFPFIKVKKDGKVSPVLFIEHRIETGEQEVGPDGKPLEIVDCVMQKYVNLEVLKEKLPPYLNDMVRVALGMKPLQEAKLLGENILRKVEKNIKTKERKNKKGKK